MTTVAILQKSENVAGQDAVTGQAEMQAKLAVLNRLSAYDSIHRSAYYNVTSDCMGMSPAVLSVR